MYCPRCGKIHHLGSCPLDRPNFNFGKEPRMNLNFGKEPRMNLNFGKEPRLDLNFGKEPRLDLNFGKEPRLDLNFGKEPRLDLCPFCGKVHLLPYGPCPNSIPCLICNSIGCPHCNWSGIGGYFR